MLNQYDIAAANVLTRHLPELTRHLSKNGVPASLNAPSLDSWLSAAIEDAMSSDSTIDRALAELMARRPSTVAEQTATDAAIAALLRAGARPPSEGGQAPPLPTHPIQTTNPMQGPFYGMGLKDACFEQLKRVKAKDAQTAKEIWAALDAAGFRSAHNDPAHAVQTALSRRASKHGDVLLVGGGKWGLKSWYTDDELEEIKKSVGGMGGRDKAEHGERTKAGMLLVKQRGKRLGAPLFMDEDRIKEAAERIKSGESISQIAEEWGKSRQAIYRHFSREDVKRLREEGAAEKQREADARRQSALRVVK